MGCPEADEESEAADPSTWRQTLQSTIRDYGALNTPVGHATVLDAAAFLLRRGVLNVKGQ